MSDFDPIEDSKYSINEAEWVSCPLCGTGQWVKPDEHYNPPVRCAECGTRLSDPFA